GRPPRERPRSRRVALDHGHVSPGRIEPTVLRAGLESVKEAGGTLEPAVGDRALAAQDEIVVAEPDGEHRRTLHVSLPPAEPVGALARLDAGGHVLDPPPSPAQPPPPPPPLPALLAPPVSRASSSCSKIARASSHAPRASAASPSRTRSPPDATSAIGEQ